MGQSQPINGFPVAIEATQSSPRGVLSDKASAMLARLTAAQTKAFEQSGENDYLDWLAAWSLEQDPVAYAFDMLAQPDRQRYFDSLSAPEKKRLVASLHTAHKLGICSPPGWRASE